jgi:hypothetical protein
VCAARGVGVYGDGAEQGMSGGPMLLPECQRDRLTARGEVFSLEDNFLILTFFLNYFYK